VSSWVARRSETSNRYATRQGPIRTTRNARRLLSVIGSWALRRLMIALELTLDAAEIAELDAATEAWRVTG